MQIAPLYGLLVRFNVAALAALKRDLIKGSKAVTDSYIAGDVCCEPVVCINMRRW